MVCPYCEKDETNVIDSRKNNDGKSIRRRRECPSCKIRFTTYEKAEIELAVNAGEELVYYQDEIEEFKDDSKGAWMLSEERNYYKFNNLK